MTPGERTFKIGFTLSVSLPCLIAGAQLPLALLLGHVCNFVLNSQIPVMMRYVVRDPGLKRRDIEKTIKKLENTAPKFGIREVLFYGSFCRHQMTSTSDLDLRFHHLPGLRPSLNAYCYAFYMRLWANLNGVPIDVYCFSDPQFLNKMNKDEYPSLLFFSKDSHRRFKRAESAWTTLAGNKGIR